MTRSSYKGDVTWGLGPNPRTVKIMTENQAGWDAYMAEAKDAVSDSRKLLRNALSAVNGLWLSKDVVRYANRYFLTDADCIDKKDLATIKSVITLTKNGLHGPTMALKVAKSEDGINGMVMGWSAGNKAAPSTKPYHNNVTMLNGGKGARMGAIHVTGDRLDMGRLGVKTMVHEATHKYAGTDDYCYFDDDGETPRGTFNSKQRALANADSYAWFVLKVGRGLGLTMKNDMFSKAA